MSANPAPLPGSSKGPAPAPAPAARVLDPVLVVMGVAFALIWSSAFTSAKIALLDAPPFSFLVVRFVLAGAVAVAIALAMGQALPRGRRIWTQLLILGLCQNTLYLGLFYLAMTKIPGGLAAIIASALPLIIAAVGPFLLSERVTPLRVAGLAMGFAGVVYIMQARLAGGVDPTGVALCVVGVMALATGAIVVRRSDFGTGLLMVVGTQMLIGGLALIPLALVMEWGTAEVTWTWRLAAAFIYTAVVPGIVAQALWFTMINRAGAGNASLYHFLTPGFGVGIAWLVLNEPVGWNDVAGVALVALGILLVNRARAVPAAR